MSTSDDFGLRYFGRDPERGDLYQVVDKRTGEAIADGRAVPYEIAEQQRTICGSQWSEKEREMLLKRGWFVPINRIPPFSGSRTT